MGKLKMSDRIAALKKSDALKGGTRNSAKAEKAVAAYKQGFPLFVSDEIQEVDLEKAATFAVTHGANGTVLLNGIRLLSKSSGKYAAPRLNLNDLRIAGLVIGVIDMMDTDQATLKQKCLELFAEAEAAWLDGTHRWLVD